MSPFGSQVSVARMLVEGLLLREVLSPLHIPKRRGMSISVEAKDRT